MKKKFQGLIVAFVAFAAVSASAAVYTGSLSYVNDTANGWFANANNDTMGWRKSSVLSWTVSNEQEKPEGLAEGFDWFYSYTLDVDKFAPVRWMIATGEGFTTNDMAAVTVSGDNSSQTYTYAVGWWEPSDKTNDDLPVLRDLPERSYGIRFIGTSGGGQNTGGSITVSFWSTYAPQWANLYANCGGHGNLGYNQGFLDPSPTDPIGSGSIDNHVLTPLPEPEVALLLALACFLTLAARRILDPDCRRALFSR